MDWLHVLEAVVAVAGAVTAVFNYLQKRLESRKLQAVVDGIDDGAEKINPLHAKVVKEAIRQQAEAQGVEDALHTVVKAREKVRNGGFPAKEES